MVWGNAVLSRTQYDVESCLTGRGCQADVPTLSPVPTEPLPIWESRGLHFTFACKRLASRVLIGSPFLRTRAARRLRGTSTRRL
jgi:hypothetical protein